MSGTIKFGTDGWRGIIAENFTFDNVRYCAQSMADYLQDAGLARQGLIVGYDTRFASERFAAAVSEVMAANGIKVYLCSGATPTPAVSYGVLHKGTSGAIIITASHNPAEWNGFKIKTAQGSSAPPEVEAEIERRLPDIMAQGKTRRISLDDGISQGLIEYIDLASVYSRHLAQLLDLGNIRRAGLKVAIDSMFGAGAGYLKKLIAGGKTEVTEINKERNPIFPGIRPEPIPPNLSNLSRLIKESGASVGLATDGDADRLGVVDEKGNPLTPLQIFALLALYFLEVRGERGAIVRTITTTSMLNKLGKIFNVPVHETPVGFKYIAPIMIAENALIGGEESSGFGFRGHIPERDGILSGIYFLDLMVRLKRTPSQLLDYLYSKVGPHHYRRIDIEFPPDGRETIRQRLTGTRPNNIAGTEVVKISTFDGFHFLLSDESWLLVRFSGTEPILRVYAEANSLARAEELIAQGRMMLEV